MNNSNYEERYSREHITKCEIEKIVGKVIPKYQIRDQMLYLYQRAFVHKSTTNQLKNLDLTKIPKYILDNNERMEYLGDSYLAASTRKYFFHKYPTMDQGDLTDIGNCIVCGPQCTKFAKKIGMEGKILMSEKTERMRGHTNKRFLEDAFEALICAICEDRGPHTVDLFVKNLIENFIDEEDYLINKNYKAMLLDYCQANKIPVPIYEVQYEKLKEGNEKCFGVVVIIENQRRGRGKGTKIKEAEMGAAKHALTRMNLLKKLQKRKR